MTQPAYAGSRGETASASQVRFLVLDSWRGVCALLVALLHFPTSSAISQSAFVGGAYLFVDFFFVLSGFVIASSYGGRLDEPKKVARFALVRFGRLYPLHLFMLLAFVAFELLRLMLPQLRGAGAAPFTEDNSIGSLVANLLLLQGTGLEDRLTWNGPSWSISTEFFAYLFFAAVVFVARKRAWAVLACAAVVGPLVLLRFADTMDVSYDFGLVRCLYGFSIGALLSWFQHDRLVEARRDAGQGTDRLIWTLLELAMIAVIALFVVDFSDNKGGIAAPLLFAVALYVFAHEGGWVSSLLRTRPMLTLGALSYSIYMVHIFVQGRMINVAGLVDRKFGLGLVGPLSLRGDTAIGIGPDAPWTGLAAIALMVAATLVASWFTWRFVEMPALALFRRLAKRI
jgi:peptidoglycan/LPS O-acetylase OafA/YrhL